MNRGRGTALAGALLLVAVAVGVLWLSGGAAVPFAIDSSAPDGYRAIRILLEERGVEVGSLAVADLGGQEMGPGEAVVVPVWDYLDDGERLELERLAASGVTVVRSGVGYFGPLDAETLTRTPAVTVSRGYCDIAVLEDMTAIDDVSGGSLAPAASSDLLCFGTDARAAVVWTVTGKGELIELGSPYMWANARLQPNKEEGGRPLDNGPMAVALLSGSERVTFLEAVPTTGVAPDGTRNPLELLPLGAKLALAQVVGAFVLFVLWRGRRLGRPVREEMPVEVAGSELVEAVGGLLRRSGSPQGAAEVVRAETVRSLGARLGVPAEAGVAALVRVVAARTGRDVHEVGLLLVSSPVDSATALVRLIGSLDALRTEVLDGQPVA